MFVVADASLAVVALLVVECGDLAFCLRLVFCFGEGSCCVVMAAGCFAVLFIALSGCGVDGREIVAEVVGPFALFGV